MELRLRQMTRSQTRRSQKKGSCFPLRKTLKLFKIQELDIFTRLTFSTDYLQRFSWYDLIR